MGLLVIDPGLIIDPSWSSLLINTGRTLQLRPSDTHIVYDWHLGANVLRHKHRSIYHMRNNLRPE